MSDNSGVRPPLPWHWLLCVAGWIVPRAGRAEWRVRWDSRLRNLWILIERGELAYHPPGHAALLVRDAFTNAFWLRFTRRGLRGWVRGPGFVVVCAALVLAFLAVLSHGFEATRSVIEAAQGWRQYPLPLMPNQGHSGYDPRADRVVAYTLPILLALATSIALVAIGRLSLHHHGWRYWWFLAAKLVAVMAIVPLLWIEGGAALRAQIPNELLYVLIGCVGLTLVFIAAFGQAVGWVFSDQRLRCPVCLKRLAMPVTIGSWGSVFEPPTTEFLCDAGHGALCISDTPTGEPDRWVVLDTSWKV